MPRLALHILGTAALAATTITPALAAPGDMTVATFAKGAMALFSSDMGLLKQEGQAAGVAYRARLGQERSAGRPSSCPPKGVQVDSGQLLGFLRTYPEPARPRTSMKTAIADYFIRTYPCR
ncbi:MAG: hypothetical protein RIQ99_2085 [Pseudomonadota bacterium]